MNEKSKLKLKPLWHILSPVNIKIKKTNKLIVFNLKKLIILKIYNKFNINN